MTRWLTLDQLKQGHACPRETKIFVDAFGDGNECTHERVMSVAQKFDWPFAAKILLTPRQQQHFRVLVLALSRGLRRINDPTQSRRRCALAEAFYQAYQGPEA